MEKQNSKRRGENAEIYKEISTIWQQVHVTENRKKSCDSCIQFWNANKNIEGVVEAKIKSLQKEVRRQNHTREKSFLSTWVKKANIEPRSNSFEPNTDGDSTENSSLAGGGTERSTTEPIEIDLSNKHKTGEENSNSVGRQNRRPAQDELNGELNKLNEDIVNLEKVKDKNLLSDEAIVKLKILHKDRQFTKKKLKTLQQNCLRQNKFQKIKKSKITNLIEIVKDIQPDAIFPNYTSPGRPRIENQQTALLKAIEDLVGSEAAADDRRRSQTVRCVQTLDDLHRELKKMNFNISRSGLYLRLVPRRWDTIEGKKHVKTVPVKLLQAQNSAHTSHQDFHFCAARIKYLRDFAELMGEKVVCVISQDDKARVPLGIPAATKQAPILMHLDYRVTLSDHDFPVAPRHKLIPSVYTALNFEPIEPVGVGSNQPRNSSSQGRKLSYSGRTYIAIRSGKHDKSSAKSHAFDMRKIFNLPSFRSSTHNQENTVNPIFIVFTDGGPDENPRFEKTMLEYSKIFKLLNLDALYVASHAPGQSAHNQVERRMSPLSHDLAGLILPHDTFGSHLNGSMQTIDTELEKRNFEKAGNVLGEIWSNTVIDGHDVYAEYIQPETDDYAVDNFVITAEWIATHIHQSQYLLQIVKCNNEKCCSTPRSDFKRVLKYHGFIPGPLKMTFSDNGRSACTDILDEAGFFDNLTSRLAFNFMEPRGSRDKWFCFDYLCPSVHEKIGERTCVTCHKYCPSKIALTKHRSVHANRSQPTQYVCTPEVQTVDDSNGNSDKIPVISDLHSLWDGPFVPDSDVQ